MAASASAWSWLQALVDGGHSRETKALLVHGGLAAFFYLFYRKKRPVRIWIDGCYDLTHFGHYNAFRQARALGDYLIVGLNPDKEVIKYKGSPPVNTDEERYQVIKACKWVDEVVRDVPYVLSEKYLQDVVFGKMQCDYVVHGDDPCLDPEGNDVFASSKRLGRYKEIKRTEGVSTTDLLGRMLQVTEAQKKGAAAGGAGIREGAGFVNFLPTSRRISEFSSNRRPKPGDRIVYVDGSFDLFHQHHINLLCKARELGDFLIVGVHKDEVINKYKGFAFPVMNLIERVLAVLSCRYVDEVVIGAPWEITNDVIKTFNITVVAHGSFYDKTIGGPADYDLAYRGPKALGIFHQLPSANQSQGDIQTVSTILERVEEQREAMARKFDKKSKAEATYYAEHREYVQEQ